MYSSAIEKIFFEDGSEYTAENTFSSAGKHTDGLDAGEYAAKKVSGAVLRVHCSKGTYIRSLVRDIAHRCGSAAYVYALRRTAVGPFTLEQAAGVSALPPFGNAAVHMESAPHLITEEEIRRAAVSLSEEIARAMHFQTTELQEKYCPAFMNGKPISGHWFTEVQPLSDGGTIAVFYEGRCAGLITKNGNRFHYQIVFNRGGVNASDV